MNARDFLLYLPTFVPVFVPGFQHTGVIGNQAPFVHGRSTVTDFWDDEITAALPTTQIRLVASIAGAALAEHKLIGSYYNGDLSRAWILGALRSVDQTLIAECQGIVEISPSSATVGVDATVTLSATVKNSFGEDLPDHPVRWESSDERVATVSAQGVVTGHAAGEVTITATSPDSIPDDVTVVVGGSAFIDFEQFSPSTVCLNNGQQTTVTVGIATISGGQIARFGVTPWGVTDDYPLGTNFYTALWDCQRFGAFFDTITITFAQPVSNFSVRVAGGHATPDDFILVQDDAGGVVAVPMGFDYSAATVTLPSTGIRRVTISTSSFGEALGIDDVRFVVAGSTTGERSDRRQPDAAAARDGTCAARPDRPTASGVSCAPSSTAPSRRRSR